MIHLRNRTEAYQNEIEKQKDPYAYFLRHAVREERGGSITVDGPLPCHLLQDKADLSANAYAVAGDQKTYVILKTDEVRLYADADCRLLREGCTMSEDAPFPALLYCDHDYQNSMGKRHTPFLKPEFSPHTLLFSNYMGEYAAVEKSLLEEILRDPEMTALLPGLNASETIYAILLNAITRTDKITHVSETLYYLHSEKTDAQIYAEYANAGSSAPLKEHVQRIMEKLKILPRDHYSLSVIIPSKDHAKILIKCLNSLKEHTQFQKQHDLEILIIDNGSYETQREMIESYIRENASLRIRYLYQEEPFNFSHMCDRGASEATGDLLLFLNDDVEFLDDCLLEMCMFASSPLTGAVGCKLLFPENKLIQHVGVTNLACGPTHKLSHHPDLETYYFGANRLNRNMLAVTGACLMVEREKYFQVQGFHDKMTVSYNDVDLCVNLYENGYYNVLLNTCVLLHHESLSRGNDLFDGDKLKRLAIERALFYERHAWLTNKPDPFYHPDLITDTLDYRVNVAADYEIRGKMSEVEMFECQSVRKSDRLQLTIERTGLVADQLAGDENAYEISGWSLYLKHDERMYDRFLLLIKDDGEQPCLKISLMPVYREDVGEVFAKEKYTALAGFKARIPASILNREEKYRVALLYVHKALHVKIMKLGAYYEPGKGYESEFGEVLSDTL